MCEILFIANSYKHGGGAKLSEVIFNRFNVVGFEVFTAVVKKSIIFWDITQCSPLSVNRLFGETYRLHLQGRKIS
jgi:hypothetical protein